MNLIFPSWIIAKYATSINYITRNELFICLGCGLEETFPFDILGDRITIFDEKEKDDKRFKDYCINCAGKFYGNELWDCLTGEKITIEKIDKYYVIKYKIKKCFLNMIIIIRFIYFLTKNIILWCNYKSKKRY